MRYFCARDFTIFHKSSTQILNKIKNDFQPNVLILILTVRFKFRMLWLLALTCQCISHFSLVNGPQGNREMPNKLMIGPDQSLLFNFRRIHLRTRPPAQFIYFQSHSIQNSNRTVKIRMSKLGCISVLRGNFILLKIRFGLKIYEKW